MPQFSGFTNIENKLRIPLSAFAAQIIENDQHSFGLKKTTLINLIIMNYYQMAECSISLRLRDYQKELTTSLGDAKAKQNSTVIDTILSNRAASLSNKYANRQPADVNWQITLNKRVKDFLTNDTTVYEERYYGDKPGRYVRALLEEYARLPFYEREEIVFSEELEKIQNAINGKQIISLTTEKGSHLAVKPVRIERDPMSMYHYLVAFKPEDSLSNNAYNQQPQVMSIRISRLTNIDLRSQQSGAISDAELAQVERELAEKTVQFVSGQTTKIRVWLSDRGLQRYRTQLHLRPLGEPDPNDPHIYTFECTEAQVLYYFIGFGKYAKVISPEPLADKFLRIYRGAVERYEE